MGVKGKQRTIKKLVGWAIALLYHRVEVRQPRDLTAEGPQIANGSHFGGFSDPLLLVYAMDRVPRFIARDVIWKFPVVRNVLNWAGAIPVHKSDDGAPTSNDEMFRSTYDALGDQDLLTIFPEGITVDDPRIANIKTGSARIALGARASGVKGITLLSAGIHYENKAALRSEVFIDIGYPLDLDAWVEQNVAEGQPQDASNREAVRALTTEMEARLRWAAPDFDDWKTATSFRTAAEVALRGPDSSDENIGHAEKERLARLIEDAPEQLRAPVIVAVDTYQADLDALGYSDEAFASASHGKRQFLRSIVVQLVLGVLLLPMALVGVVINAIPMIIVWLIGKLKVADAVMATIKPIGAIFAFLVTWGVWMWFAFGRSGGLDGRGFGFFALTLVTLPLYLLAVIAIVERFVLLTRAFRSFARARSTGDVYDRVQMDRKEVVEAVAQAV